ncbi:hypothetical protein [Phreatobacter stygius]|uniref:Uncharacterized protein n=1 Tax=Phreatobacter stygius TaxID=1940610 RepID=A0A4D7B1M9_9HYPH|nr:hypothetical protein [Phreatobacter stygius]QCI67514.1 hypothetical protein E8M01_26795 [Phreatobacter stygius]
MFDVRDLAQWWTELRNLWGVPGSRLKLLLAERGLEKLIKRHNVIFVSNEWRFSLALHHLPVRPGRRRKVFPVSPWIGGRSRPGPPFPWTDKPLRKLRGPRPRI